MELDWDQIHQLMNEKVMGVISETDEQHLQNALKEYPELQTELEHLEEEYAIWLQDPAIQQIDSEADFALIAYELKKRQVRKRKGIAVGFLFVAATITLAIFFTYPYFVGTSNPVKTTSPQLTLNKTLQLQLSNGEVIDLSTKQDSITVNGNTRLNNSNNALTYTVRDNPATQNQVNSLWVPAGMDYHITLSDGSLIFLNSATTLKFPFHFSDTREITIDGEAYVQVAKDQNRPFILHTPKGTIQVLGTTFNVNTYDSGRVKVSLVDGAVSFAAADNKQTLLKPGQAITYTEDKGVNVAALNENELLWIKGRYKLENTPMMEITKVLPRWYGVKVIIDNPKIAEKRFTGTILKAEPVQEFLDAIKLTTGADSYYKDGILHIR